MTEKDISVTETIRIPNAIEHSVILRTHTDIPEQLEQERAVIIPGEGISDKEARGLPELYDYRIRYKRPKGELFIKDIRIRVFK